MKIPRDQSGRPCAEYHTWQRIRARCSNKNHHHYKYYGGRGITVCERWQKFSNFYADMGKKPSPEHSLDRINNDSNYEPGNCRWATATTQTRNSRRVHSLTIDGVTMCISAWSEKTGLKAPTIRYRLRHGLDPIAPLSRPSN